jgi:hypothetical protein
VRGLVYRGACSSVWGIPSGGVVPVRGLVYRADC